MTKIEILKDGFVGPGGSETYKYLTKHLPADWYGFALKEIPVRQNYVVRLTSFWLAENPFASWRRSIGEGLYMLTTRDGTSIEILRLAL